VKPYPVTQWKNDCGDRMNVKELKFPHDTMRKGQREIMDELNEFMERPVKKVVMLRAETGFGKTATAIYASARVANRIFYVAPRKNLREQAEMTARLLAEKNPEYEFEIITLFGRNNYLCVETGETADTCINSMIYRCPAAPTNVKKGAEIYYEDIYITRDGTIRGFTPGAPYCEYYRTKAKVVSMNNNPKKIQIIILTTAYFISEFIYSREITPADIVILDEAHNIEHELVNAVKFEISERALSSIFREKYTFPKRAVEEDELKVVLGQLRIELERYVEDAKTQLQTTYMTKREQERLIRNAMRAMRLISIIEYLLKRNDLIPDFIEKRTKGGETYKILRVRVLNVDDIFKEMINATTAKDGTMFLMSATLPEKDEMGLGIDAFENKYFVGKSGWKKSRRPVIILKGNRINYANQDDIMPTVLEQIIYLLNEVIPENWNVVIHSHTIKNTKMFEAGISSQTTRTVLTHRMGDTNTGEEKADVVLSRFKELKNTGAVLISPSMTEGVSFDDDICRLQFIVKAPFPSMNDVWIKKKTEQDKNFPKKIARITLEQMIGRIIRNENDYGLTVIFDTAVAMLLPKGEKPFAFQNVKFVNTFSDVAKIIKKFVEIGAEENKTKTPTLISSVRIKIGA